MKEEGELGDPQTLMSDPTRKGARDTYCDYHELVHVHQPTWCIESTFRDLIAVSQFYEPMDP